MENQREFKADLPIEDIKGFIYERTQINQEKLNQTTENIKTKGVIEPIIVRRTKDGFELIAGYLRFLASQKAEKKTIPSIIYENIEDLDATDLLLTENLHRQELSDYDEAILLSIFEKQGMTHKEIGSKLNVTGSYITQKLSLLRRYTEPLSIALSKGTITQQKAIRLRALSDALPKKTADREIKRLIPLVREKTVRETFKTVHAIIGSLRKEQLKKDLKDAEKQLKDYETAIRKRDSLNVLIAKTKGNLKAVRLPSRKRNKLIRQIEQVETVYFPAKREIERLTIELKSLKKKIGKPTVFTKKVKQLSDSTNQLESKATTLQTKISRLYEEIKKLREQKNPIEKELKATKTELNNLIRNDKNRIKAEKDLKRQKELMDSIENKQLIVNFDKVKNNLETQDKKALEKRLAIEKHVSTLQSERNSLNSKIANLKTLKIKIANLKAQLRN